MLPYSGQISYGQIRDEFGGTGTFDLQNAYNGTYGALNPYSYIQPINPGGVNYSPDQWYGYDGAWIVTSGLVINYDAWPTIGSYPGFGTNVINPVGGYPGTLNNGMNWTGGVGGGTFILDGTDDYLSTFPSLNPITDLTVEMWVQAQGLWTIGAGAGQSTYNVDDWGSSNMWLLHPNVSTSATYMTFYVNANPPGSSTILTATTATLLNLNTWYQIVGTYSATATKIYVNGALSGTGVGGGGIINNGSSTLVLGGDPRYTFRRFNGYLSVFHMYDRELSAGEVLQNWNAIRGRYTL